ncbi:copper amine oxidase N-terminal domain-containing protein [Defluviitalea phaphyphila]|uniref:copper amine oxidase N-terminal domain-containing protein n=1 Tax=Defluviitalea phaphyphila TaxID=1473580 RepID=UPI0007302761|nr:copper amine oxidase N-terminal domain-containing protein [Defluviitalea phaphyphila]
MKKRLAALLAGAMVLTSLPMVSFARSDNHVTYAPSVTKDTKFTIDTAPVLIIEEKDDVDIEGQTIRLEFDGAEWQPGDGETAEGIVYDKITKKLVEITFPDNADQDKYEIPLLVKVKNEGEVTVTINPLNSKVSGGTYVIANAGSGSTKTFITSTSDFPDRLELAEIVIDELKANSVSREEDKEIKLEAPRGFEWQNIESVSISGSGAFRDKISLNDVNYDEYGNNKYDKEILIIKYDIDSDADENEIGSIVISGLVLEATEDAELGDVEVEVSGDDITEETITVGEYVEYGVEISVEDDTKQIVSGRYYNGKDDDDDYKLLQLTIEEKVEDSWWSQRNTTIEFPDGVKVRKVKVDDSSNVYSDEDFDNSIKSKEADGVNNESFLKINEDRDTITLTDLYIPDGKKGEVTLDIWVSIEADYEGDIVATVGGPSLDDDQEVVLGEAVPAVTASFDTTELKIGYKEVAVNEFEIQENIAGALQKGGTLIIRPEYPYMEFDDDFDIEVEVVEGDLEIGDYDLNKYGALEIEIKRESDEPSTIKVSGAGVYTSRSLAEGSYDLEVYGDAFLQNYEDDVDEEEEGFETDVLSFEDFIKVATPAPDKGEASGQVVKATFTVGSNQYTIGDEVATADAAPYIENGRTMVPVKYVAYALGIDPQKVQWDQATKTVTIYGDKVVNITIGKKEIVVGGTPVPMDTAAVVKDGRTYIPIAYAARALGVPYTWDDATKTVTFN